MSQITKSLLFLSILATAFVFGRGDILQYTGLGYLIWNLFLAWVPYLLSLYFLKKEAPLKQFIPVFILWLLFFPNATYLVTDILHVASSAPQSLWYDSLTFFTFGLTGLLLGVASLSHIEEYLVGKVGQITREIILFTICFVSSFGIYLGRFERWNSWDFFIHPSTLIRHSYAISLDAGRGGTTLVFIAVFTLFTYLIYKILNPLINKNA